jgi:uncharacterized protein (DUF3820 family)
MITAPYTDATKMPFGRYVGKPLIEVPGVYLLWCYDNNVGPRELRMYIESNLQAIKKEAGQR